MIISNSRSFIFIHIMKTAGTSICAALDPFLKWNDVILGGTPFGEQLDRPYRERFGLLKHSTASQIRGVVGNDVWSRYFTFAFVRHPHARTVSLYTWLAATLHRDPDPASPARSWPSMQAFVEAKNFSEFIRHEKFLTSMAGRPQVEWVCDDAGRGIVDFVGRVEDLDAGMRTVSARLGLPLEPLGRHNPSPAGGSAPRPVVTAADYEQLARHFRRDFEHFGYDPAWRPPASA